MSTQVIVVKRSRRRLFSVLRALPDLVRAIWAGRPGGARKAQGELHHFEASAGTAARFGTSYPRLGVDSSGEHRCVACDLCVQICPSRCLQMESEESAAGSRRVIRFELMRASCISCGMCRDECPENAIEMISRDPVARWADVGRRAKIDLLAIAE
jgi:ferredoxin